jgi:hypothetical protein
MTTQNAENTAMSDNGLHLALRTAGAFSLLSAGLQLFDWILSAGLRGPGSLASSTAMNLVTLAISLGLGIALWQRTAWLRRPILVFFVLVAVVVLCAFPSTLYLGFNRAAEWQASYISLLLISCAYVLVLIAPFSSARRLAGIILFAVGSVVSAGSFLIYLIVTPV